jgi:hypothetical protein
LLCMPVRILSFPMINLSMLDSITNDWSPTSLDLLHIAVVIKSICVANNFHCAYHTNLFTLCFFILWLTTIMKVSSIIGWSNYNIYKTRADSKLHIRIKLVLPSHKQCQVPQMSVFCFRGFIFLIHWYITSVPIDELRTYTT